MIKQADVVFYENENNVFLKDLLTEEIDFIRKIREFEDTTLIQTFDAMSFVLHETKEMFEMIKKMKRILRAAHQMTTSLVLVEAIEKICDETCDILTCDRATVFLLDASKGEIVVVCSKRV